MKKYISFIFTCGGDSGSRFSNGPEWNSCEGQLLFDADIWTMESIQDAIRDLYRLIDRKACFTMSEEMENLFEYLDPFVDNNEGVYINDGYIQSDGLKGWHAGTDSSKRINPDKESIITWNINGNTRCEYYVRN